MSKSAGMIVRVLLCQILILQSSLSYAAKAPATSSTSSAASTIQQAISGPVAVTSIAVTPLQAKIGDTITETATITATSDFRGVLVMGMRVAAQGMSPLASERSKLEIKAGESVTRSLKWTIPANAPVGNYRAFARVMDKNPTTLTTAKSTDSATTASTNERIVVSREGGLFTILSDKIPSTAYTIQLGDTKQSLLTPLNLPKPTIVATGWAPVVTAPGTASAVISPGTSYHPTLVGNSGNNVFYESADYVTLNPAAGGVNTNILSVGDGVYKAPAGIANVIYAGNLTLEARRMAVQGNELDNTLVTGDSGIGLMATAGNDTLVGGKGPDVFTIPEAAGNVTVIGLHPKSDIAGGSVIQLDKGTFGNFLAIKGAMVQHGSDVVLTRPNGKTVTIVNTTIDALTPDLFVPTSASFTDPLPGACGTSNGVIMKSAPLDNLCNAGDASAVTFNQTAGLWSWNCTGKFGGYTAPCATTTYLTTNGACGTASGVGASSAPSANLCSAGQASSVAQNGSTWNWSCDGLNGGNATSCTAPTVGTDGVCGMAHHSHVASAPTANLCAAGAASPVRGNGSPWTWDCQGLNGGSAMRCMAMLLPTDGACGSAHGTNASSAPTAGLCATGSASAITGSGPFNWSCAGANGGANARCATATNVCMGTTIPAQGSVVLPPNVLRPSASNDIVGVNIQNTSVSATGDRVTTFGQVFKQGQVKTTDTLVAKINSTNRQLQMDTLATWPDGSVKLAALSVQLNLCAKSQVQALITKPATDPGFSKTAITLTDKNIPLTAKVDFTGGNYSAPLNLDLGAALKTALSSGKADYWLKGPLATQARVDVPITGGTPNTLHVTADITAYADGTYAADVQFNNDLTTVSSSLPAESLPWLQYTASIDLAGATASYPIAQQQYTNWHKVLRTQYLPFVNVQHDVAYLQHTGAVLPNDRTTGVSNALLDRIAVQVVNAPLANSNVTPYMPGTGGRPDIGYTTLFNTAWILSQDARAAAIGLAQSDTSGAVPWNVKLATNGHWLTPGDSKTVWFELEGRAGSAFVANLPDATKDRYWITDIAHQPNLNYIPYIMTGSRWNLDRLNAQAASSMTSVWPGDTGRCAAPSCDIVIMASQIRAAAWALREVQQAGFVGQPGSFEQAYFAKVAENNYAWLKSQIPAMQQLGGEVYGYLGLQISNGNVDHLIVWQEDFMTGIMVQGAQMGIAGAKDIVAWQSKVWLPGRFIGKGMNPYDSCLYDTPIGDGHDPAKTWAEIENLAVAKGVSYGTGWKGGNYYPSLGRSSLGGALTLFPGDPALTQALTWLNNSNAPTIDPLSLQNDPTFSLVPLQPE